MEFKYTNGGKKVIVVGKLNNTETIVQEVFICDGNEIPSGENFVVKSLHDAPAVSWKEAEIKKMDAMYETKEKELERKLDILRDAQERAEQVYRACAGIIRNTNEKVFEQAAGLISGKYKYAVQNNSWSAPEISEINQYITDRDGWNYEMRLISLFGKSDGDFSWRLNRWSDGSGGWSDFVPCVDMKEAIETARVMIESKDYYTDPHLEFLKKHNLPINDEKLQKMIGEKRKSIAKDISESFAKIEKLNKQLEEL